MNKAIFEENIGRRVKLTLKPKDLVLDGVIEEVYTSCVKFKTTQMTSYLSFDKINSMRLL